MMIASRRSRRRDRSTSMKALKSKRSVLLRFSVTPRSKRRNSRLKKRPRTSLLLAREAAEVVVVAVVDTAGAAAEVPQDVAAVAS